MLLSRKRLLWAWDFWYFPPWPGMENMLTYIKTAALGLGGMDINLMDNHKVEGGEWLIILGAAGSVGQFAVQVFRPFLTTPTLSISLSIWTHTNYLFKASQDQRLQSPRIMLSWKR